MFISKAEKELLFFRIDELQKQVNDLTAKVVILSKFPETRNEKKKRQMSPENRAKLSAMMKKRHADSKAKGGSNGGL
jgi:hypothetical protein